MCRLIAYWGPPVPIVSLVVEPAHGLVVQCTAAREQTSGHENPDGWGVGWYPDDALLPRRYRSTTPMPADRAGLEELSALTAGRFVAHVRHKSPGSPTELAGNAPFMEGRLLFAHNGFVEGFRSGLREQLRDQLTPRRRAGLRGDADSEVLFGLVLDRIDAGDDLADALGRVIAAIDQPDGKFNIVLTDGEQMVASRWGNSLHLRRDQPHPGSIIVASEPYDDDPDWECVPEHSLVRIDAEGVTSSSLSSPSAEALP